SGTSRPRGALRAGVSGARSRGGCARRRGARAVRDLGGLRRGGGRGRRTSGTVTRARARARRAAPRAELPRHCGCEAAAERDVRTARAPTWERGFLLAERRARPRSARARGRTRTRSLVIRVDWEQGRRLVQRPARVLGGGP